MKFLVTVADRQTGKETTATIDAATEDQAMRLAAKEGWLVSDVRPMRAMDAPAAIVPEYSSPPTSAVRAKDYKNIETSASSLTFLQQFFAALGWLTVVGMALAFGAAVSLMALNSAAPENELRVASLMVTGISFCLSAIILFAVSAIMRMMAAMGLALRDLTINSYRI